jgi:hypothetical protein
MISMLSDLLFRLRAIFRAKSMDASLAEELQFHLDRQLEKYVQAGLSPEEARRRVRLDFGGPTQITEECRQARGTLALEALRQDLRYGFRTLRRNSGFTCAICRTYSRDTPQISPALAKLMSGRRSSSTSPTIRPSRNRTGHRSHLTNRSQPARRYTLPSPRRPVLSHDPEFYCARHSASLCTPQNKTG